MRFNVFVCVRDFYFLKCTFCLSPTVLGSSYMESLASPCMESVSCNSLPCNLLLLSQSPVDVMVGPGKGKHSIILQRMFKFLFFVVGEGPCTGIFS